MSFWKKSIKPEPLLEERLLKIVFIDRGTETIKIQGPFFIESNDHNDHITMIVYNKDNRIIAVFTNVIKCWTEFK